MFVFAFYVKKEANIMNVIRRLLHVVVEKWKNIVVLLFLIWTCVVVIALGIHLLRQQKAMEIFAIDELDQFDGNETNSFQNGLNGEYGACGFLDVPNEVPKYWSTETHVVLRSVYWDSRQFEGLRRGFWVFLAVAEKQIVLNNLITGVQVEGDTFHVFDLREPEWNDYIDKICPNLTHKFIVIRCNAPFVFKPHYTALLYKTDPNGVVLSAVSENPAIANVMPRRKSRRNEVISCLAPGHGKPINLRHWIRYEQTIGVSHIHVIADESFVENGTLNDTVVKKALETGFLSIAIWPRRFTSWQVFYREQVLAYQDCVHRFQGLYDYVFPHDADDFFVPLIPGAKLDYYIDQYCPKGTCSFPWEQIDPPNSGLTGTVGSDGNVTDKVVAKHSRITRVANKCIHRLEDTFEVGIHEAAMYVKCCMTTYIPSTVAYVCHVRY